LRPGSAPFAFGKPWRSCAAVLVLILAPVALFFPALFQRQLIFGHDVVALGFPIWVEVHKCLAAHQWPLWFPDILGGMPGIASCNLSFFYPTVLIAAFSGVSLQMQEALDAVIHVALAGAGMFLFLRRLKLSLSGALLGACFFAFSGSQLSQLFGGYYNFVEGIALVPWAFWAAHKGVQEKSWFAWGLCGLVLALQILAVAIQIVAYTLPALAVFTVVLASKDPDGLVPSKQAGNSGKQMLRATLGLALALGLAFLLSAPQLWPVLQYFPYSLRSNFSDTAMGAFRLSEAITWLVPGFFGWHAPTYHGSVSFGATSEYFGLLPWALAFAAASAFWRSRALVPWMVGLAMSALVVSVSPHAPWGWLLPHLPVYSGFRYWHRVLFLLTFAVCTLAAMGWDALFDENGKAAARRGAVLFLISALLIAGLAWILAPFCASTDAPGLLPATHSAGAVQDLAATLTAISRQSAWTTLGLLPVLLLVLAATRGKQRLMALALALAFHGLEQWPLLTRYVQFTNPGILEGTPNYALPPPGRPGLEPWRVNDYSDYYPNNTVLMGYENLSGAESVPLRSYHEMQLALLPRPELWFDLFNVRYVFVHSQAGPYDADRVNIFENKSAFPRAWLATRSRLVSGDEEAWRLLGDPVFKPREEVALEREAPLNSTKSNGSIRWTARSPLENRLEVSTEQDAALVLSNPWYPSWMARIDGQDAPVLKADGGLQAVLLKAGHHQVEIRFDSSLISWALAACAAGLLILAGLGWFNIRRANHTAILRHESPVL
jgi:hypothetical protein